MRCPLRPGASAPIVATSKEAPPPAPQSKFEAGQQSLCFTSAEKPQVSPCLRGCDAFNYRQQLQGMYTILAHSFALSA